MIPPESRVRNSARAAFNGMARRREHTHAGLRR